MPVLFITGDRSIPADFAIGLTALQMLKAKIEDPSVTFATGTEQGVEAAVRFICEKAGCEVEIFETPTINEEGHKDFGLRAQNAMGMHAFVKFQILHADPHTSRITNQMLAAVPEELVEIVHPSLV